MTARDPIDTPARRVDREPAQSEGRSPAGSPLPRAAYFKRVRLALAAARKKVRWRPAPWPRRRDPTDEILNSIVIYFLAAGGASLFGVAVGFLLSGSGLR